MITKRPVHHTPPIRCLLAPQLLGRTFLPCLHHPAPGKFLQAGRAEQQRSEHPDQQTTGGQSKLQPPAALMRSVLCTGAPQNCGTQPAGPALCSLPQQQEHQGEKNTQAAPRAALPSLASLRKVYPGAATEAKSREMQTRCQRTRCYPGKRSTRTHHNHCLPRQADGSELRVELSYG